MADAASVESRPLRLRRVLLPTKQPIKHFHIFLVGFDVFDLAHVVGEGAGGSLDAREQAEGELARSKSASDVDRASHVALQRSS